MNGAGEQVMAELSADDKRAVTLMVLNLKDDAYHNTIQRAASVLALNHRMGGFNYVTQWSSGTTLWRFNDETVTVDVEGNLG